MQKKVATWLRYWLGVLLVGVACGVVAGGYEATRTGMLITRNDYFGNHLYATGLQYLNPVIDHLVPWTIGVVMLLAGAVRLADCWQDTVRRRLRVVFLVAMLVALCVYYLTHNITQWLILKNTLIPFIRDNKGVLLGPFGLLIPLGVFGWIEWRIIRARRRAAMPVAKPKERSKASRRPILLAPIWRVLRFGAGAVIALIFTGYLGLHLAQATLRVSHQRALRDRPNIIFIMIDTLRLDHVGCYGYDLPTTPNIDRFAQTGTRFANAIAPASWTVWSVNSIFTGEYPDVVFHWHQTSLRAHGVVLNQAQLSGTGGSPQRFTTLAEVLRDLGYSTNAAMSNPWLMNTPGNAQGYDWYDDSAAHGFNRDTSPPLTRVAVDRLRQVKNRPFFMYVAYMDPHAPYDAHPGLTFGDSGHDLRKEALLPKDVTPQQRLDRRESLHRYNSEIAYTDHSVGDLLAEIKRLGLYDRSLIVFFSDHGEEFREHGGTDHERTVYQEVIQVPCIIKLPHQQTGKVVAGAFPLLDLYPSVLAYLHYQNPRLSLRGDRVALPTLMRCADKPIFSATSTTMKCMISGRLKYVSRDRPKMQQVFDLAADPMEQRNLLKQQAAPTDLVARFEAWDRQNALLEIKYSGSAAERQRLLAVDPATLPPKAVIDQLHSLGYLNN